MRRARVRPDEQTISNGIQVQGNRENVKESTRSKQWEQGWNARHARENMK